MAELRGALCLLTELVGVERVDDDDGLAENLDLHGVGA
jgi:hypothetical protein